MKGCLSIAFSSSLLKPTNPRSCVSQLKHKPTWGEFEFSRRMLLEVISYNSTSSVTMWTIICLIPVNTPLYDKNCVKCRKVTFTLCCSTSRYVSKMKKCSLLQQLVSVCCLKSWPRNRWIMRFRQKLQRTAAKPAFPPSQAAALLQRFCRIPMQIWNFIFFKSSLQAFYTFDIKS